jgi:hypothetical protein
MVFPPPLSRQIDVAPRRVRRLVALILLLLLVPASGAFAQSSSYASSASDVVGSTGSAAVALGVADYEFINDAAEAYGGSNSDVFDVGESTLFGFPALLRDIPGQHDLVISAFVGGLGATDDAQVQVEVSSDGVSFVVVDVFDTDEARNRPQDEQENDFEGVKHFLVDFAGVDPVSQVRLTNLSGTSEGLRLDSLEGLHPDIDSAHAFEIRFERYRPDFNERFLVRIKNISGEGGVPIREFRIDRPTSIPSTLEDTDDSLFGVDGEFLCVENCIPDNGPLIDYTRMVWSLDGLTEAPESVGLEPGRQASHTRDRNFDLDTLESTYLSGYSFTVTFADGYAHTFDFDGDVFDQDEIGALYQKYLYFSSTPAESGPRQVHHYEFIQRSPGTVTFSDPGGVGTGHQLDANGRLLFDSQNFPERGMHVEGMWVPNDGTEFITGHFHSLADGLETSHGFETAPGLGGDLQGFYIEAIDGGTFDLVSLDYELQASTPASNILVSEVYDPLLPAASQFTAYPIVPEGAYETLVFSEFWDLTTLFIAADFPIGDQFGERIRWDNFVFAAPEVLAADDFGTGDLAGGTGAWTGPWTPSGDVQVLPPGNGAVGSAARLFGSATLERSVDIANDFNPRLSLCTAVEGYEAGDSAVVEASADGIFYTPLLTLTDADSDGQFHCTVADLGSIGGSSAFELRVTTTADDSVGDVLAIDDVELIGNRHESIGPVADPGLDVGVEDLDDDGAETLTIDGTGSFDPFGSLVSYTWRDNGVIVGTTATYMASFPVGSRQLTLTVEDADGNRDMDSVWVHVFPLGGVAPVADAGPDISSEDGDGGGDETITLDGTASYDLDDAIASYEWFDGATLLGTGATLSVTLPVGVHDIELVLVDVAAHTASDFVRVEILASSVGAPPAYAEHQASAEASNVTTHTLDVSGLTIDVGDFLVAHLCVDGGGSTSIACPTGWTEHINASASGVLGAVCTKQADAGDAGATSYPYTTSVAQQSQNGVVILTGHDATDPIEAIQWVQDSDTSPTSPAFAAPPSTTSTVLRFMCANGGQVSEGVGYPAGMVNELWLEESADGFSGPTSGGAAVDVAGASGVADWTNALATAQSSVNMSIAVRGAPSGLPVADAGGDIVVYDDDGNGLESVLLDGSASFDPDGSIVSWSWSDGSLIGVGETLSADFPIGVHLVTLTVEDPSENTAMDTVSITVYAMGGPPPVADAGADVSVTDDDESGAESVTLDGSLSSDEDGAIVSWTWSEGATALGTGETLAVPFSVGVHTVTLTVEDDLANPDTDEVIVTVNAPAAIPPVAGAGADATVVDLDDSGAELVTLDGSASSDPDGSVVSWTWTEGATVLGTGETLDVSLAVGIHTITLTAEDDDANTDDDTVIITVDPFPGIPPTADAGPGQVLTDGDGGGDELVTLDGSASSDPDGSIVSWTWTEGATTLGTGAVLPTTLPVGTHSIVLTVEDDQANTDTDSVSVVINPPGARVPAVFLGHQLSEETSNATTHTMGADTLLVTEGDLLVAHLCVDGGTAAGMACPAGWTQQANQPAQSNGVASAVCTRVADAADAAAASFDWTTSRGEQSQSGLLLFTGQDPVAPIEAIAVDPTGASVSPSSPALGSPPDSSSQVLRFLCANGGQVTEGSGFPAGMANELWVEETSDGFSGPVSSGAAIDPLGASGAAEWTNVLATGQQTVGVTLAILGGVGAPVADAGVDVAVTDLDEDGFEDVTLDGSGSFDPNGSIVSWTWSDAVGPIGSGPTLPVSFPVGTWIVTLTVEDDEANVDTDTVSIVVNPSTGAAPIADAGADVTVVDVDDSGAELVTLDGSGSSDPDGTIQSWTWSEGVSPLGNGELLGVSLGVGTHTITLTVEDDATNTAIDTVVVTVDPAPGVPPTANAGADQILTDDDDGGDELVTLDGSASSDSDGTIQSWVWSEGATTLGTGETLDVTLPVGAHAITLTVEDDDSNTDADTVTVVVNAPGARVPAVFLGHQHSEESANATTHTIAADALPVAEGDLLVAHLCVDGGNAANLTCPAGWNEDVQQASQIGGVSGAVCSKVADAADEAATSFVWTTSRPEQSQSGLLLFAGQDLVSPVENVAVAFAEVSTSPTSPALAPAPESTSHVVRLMCANAGQVTEGVGYPVGMSAELWLLETNDGFSGPVSSGAALEGLGAAGSAEWTGALATGQQSVNITLAIRGGEGQPVADAGVDVNITDADDSGAESVTLDGSASFDPNGSIIDWSWSDSGGLLGTGETLPVSFLVGSHTVTLTVEDDEANQDTDTVQITVNPVGGHLPVADAGPDQSATDFDEDGFETVTLDGSGSLDADGSIVSWSWSEGAVPLGTGETLPISLAIGVHTVTLSVEDDDANTSTDAVEVEVVAFVAPAGGYSEHQTSEETTNETSHDLDVSALTIDEGDLLIAHACIDGGGGASITCPAGWTTEQNISTTGAAAIAALCWKEADAADALATSFTYTTSVPQESQNGVIVVSGHDSVDPIEGSSLQRNENDTSPESPPLASAPAPDSLVLRFMCANGGQVVEGSGFPSGMRNELWVLESNDGSSGPVSGGAAVDLPGASDGAEWTDALQSAERSVNFSLSIRLAP